MSLQRNVFKCSKSKCIKIKKYKLIPKTLTCITASLKIIYSELAHKPPEIYTGLILISGETVVWSRWPDCVSFMLGTAFHCVFLVELRRFYKCSGSFWVSCHFSVCCTDTHNWRQPTLHRCYHSSLYISQAVVLYWVLISPSWFCDFSWPQAGHHKPVSISQTGHLAWPAQFCILLSFGSVSEKAAAWTALSLHSEPDHLCSSFLKLSVSEMSFI